MAGPGARIVDRVGVLALPDTSKFQPALKKYLARIERTLRVEVEVDLDAEGLDRQVERESRRSSRKARPVEVGAALRDGFLSQVERDLKAALARVEAEAPLTADGERLRRDMRTQIEQAQAQANALAIAVPIDPEAGARARADLAAEVARLDAVAKSMKIEVPVDADVSHMSKSLAGAGGGIPSGGPKVALAVISALAALTPVVGAAIAALPALLASVALPVAAIALGMDGIKAAAERAKPAFDGLRTAVSAAFEQSMGPGFDSLARILEQITPQMSALGDALGTAFSDLMAQLASPEGISAIQGIIEGITEAVQILSPALAPMVQSFIDLAERGVAAFAEHAPQLRDVLIQFADSWSRMVQDGTLDQALDLFVQIVPALIALTTWLLMGAVQVAALTQQFMQFRAGVEESIGGVFAKVGEFQAFLAGLPARALTALAGLVAAIVGPIAEAWSQGVAKGEEGATSLVATILTLPGRAAAALAGLPGAVLAPVAQAGAAMAGAATRAVASFVGILMTMPSRSGGAVAGVAGAVLAAVSYLPGQLFSVGASMISSLASGMISQLSSVARAAASVAGQIAGFFRGSPVKWGPLRSWNHGGDTTGAGRKMAADLASGLTAGQRNVARSSEALAASLAGATRRPAAPGPAVAGAASGDQGAAIVAALRSMRPVVEIDGRQFYGVMREVDAKWGNR